MMRTAVRVPCQGGSARSPRRGLRLRLLSSPLPSPAAAAVPASARREVEMKRITRMRFSENGYYVEKYLKCANCGLLVYGPGHTRELAGKTGLYCSQWCIEWAAKRAAYSGYFKLSIVQPKLPIEEKHARKADAPPPDIVMMKILDSTMVSICREMGILLMKTSYSTIFNEGLDFTCALADTKGDMIACAEFCPTMIGGMPILIK